MSTSLKLFDCDLAYGRGTTSLLRDVETMDDALAEMDHCGIDQALVWHRDAWERDFDAGNRRLTEIAGQPRLHRSLAFVPTCCQDMPSAEQFVEKMRAGGVRAVRAFPNKHSFLLDAVSCGDLLELFVENSIPVLVPMADIGWNSVYSVMRDFPKLSLVITQTGPWGADRFFRPLMKKYSNFCVSTNRYEVGGHLKSLVDAVGYRQLLFGSGLPFQYPGGYIMMVARADISDEAREAIAHGNIERMLGEVPW